MADAVVLAGWEGQGVNLSQVGDIMSRLRRQSAHAATRTTVATIVIVAFTDEDEARATGTVHALGDRHPARVLIIRPEPDGPDGIDARLSVWGAPDGTPEGPDGTNALRSACVTMDEVCLTVRGGAAAHLESVIEPLTLPDVPLVVWYPGRVPPASAQLLGLATTIIVDSKEAGDPPALQAVANLKGTGRAIVDLSWIRLTPWRELLAGLFEGDVFAPLARAIRSGRIEGKPGPRHLLAGWLISRLGLGTGDLELVDRIHAGIHLEAVGGGTNATIDVIRSPTDRVVRAEVAFEGGPSRATVVPLPDDSLSWSVARALCHGSRDRTWEEALGAAVGLGP